MVAQVERHYSEAKERRSRRFRIHCEAIYFLSHVVNRIAFAEFGPEIRTRLHEKLMPQVLEVFVRSGYPSLPDTDVEGFCTELYGQLVEKDAEYGSLPFPAVDPLNMPESVVGLFSDTISELAGNGELRTGLSPPKDHKEYFAVPYVVAKIVEDGELSRKVRALGSQLCDE